MFTHPNSLKKETKEERIQRTSVTLKSSALTEEPRISRFLKSGTSRMN